MSIDGNKVVEHLRTRWHGTPCPMCTVGKWQVQESVYQLSEFKDGALVVGGPGIPVIPVTCGNCGNTILINAIAAGILKPGGAPNE